VWPTERGRPTKCDEIKWRIIGKLMNELDPIIYKLLTSSGELTPEAISDILHIPLPQVRASLERLMLEMKASERSILAGIGDDSIICYWSAK
jgi:hypothetical protein